MPFRFFSLPHLRLLKSSFMKTNPSSFSSRGNEVFTRVFPHKLKYQSLSSSNYSSRPSRNNPETRSAKSLIEDEAELSDWVSELKSDSFKKSRLYSDSDGDGGGGGGGDNDSDWRGKRKRESDSRGKGRSGGDFGVERGRGRGSGDSRGPGRFRDEMRTDLRARGRFGGELGRRNDGSRKSFEKRKDAFNDGLVPKRGGKSGSRGGFMVSDDEEDLGRKRTMRKFSELISDDDDDDDDNDDDDDDEGNIDLDDGNDGGILEKLEKPARVNPPPRSSPDGSESYLSETRFDQCAVSPLSLKAIKDAGYEKMTVVQEATLPVILKGKDVLAKARTGTGKTVAFLLPSIETVVKSPAVSRDQKRPPIMVLIICPTRELASQAAMEANKLIKYHPSIGVQVVIGGTRLGLEQKRMQASPCQILVATPGRLRDHIENTAGFATRLMGVKVLVLDEADHLLDMGFRKDIEKIIAAVPKQRQTLLFSATVPPEVRQICHVALKRDHEYINTVREGSEETHTQVQQTHLVAPLDQHFSLLYTLLKDHISDDPDYKVLVFCTTAKVTQLVADLLGELKLNIREIHSRKAQTYRTRVSDEFRRSKGLILVTSDVSARGVDYPDVTLVIQVGLPADKAQYIHRLGRTGRKGKEGEGVLILAPWEQFFLSTIKDLPISKREPPLVDPDTKKKVEKAMCNVDTKNKESAYQAWLGYYNSNKTIAKDKYRLVELANEFSRSMGLDNPPAIPKLVLGKMGLKNIPGLRSK